jgi:hypothetical protein
MEQTIQGVRAKSGEKLIFLCVLCALCGSFFFKVNTHGDFPPFGNNIGEIRGDVECIVPRVGAPHKARGSVLREYWQHGGSPRKGHSTGQRLQGVE